MFGMIVLVGIHLRFVIMLMPIPSTGMFVLVRVFEGMGVCMPMSVEVAVLFSAVLMSMPMLMLVFMSVRVPMFVRALSHGVPPL